MVTEVNNFLIISILIFLANLKTPSYNGCFLEFYFPIIPRFEFSSGRTSVFNFPYNK